VFTGAKSKVKYVVETGIWQLFKEREKEIEPVIKGILPISRFVQDNNNLWYEIKISP